MMYGIYSVYDRLVGYNAPFIMKNDEIAQREFKTYVAKNPNAADLRLVQLGEFNDETGEITGYGVVAEKVVVNYPVLQED